MFQTQLTKLPHSRSDLLCDSISRSDSFEGSQTMKSRTLRSFFTDGQWTPVESPNKTKPNVLLLSSINDPSNQDQVHLLESETIDNDFQTSSAGYFSANSSLSSSVSLPIESSEKKSAFLTKNPTHAFNEANETSTSFSTFKTNTNHDSFNTNTLSNEPQQQHQTTFQYRCQQHLLNQHHSCVNTNNNHHHQQQQQQQQHPHHHHHHQNSNSDGIHEASSGFSSVQPLIAMRRVMLLYENLQHEEAANFILRLNEQTFAMVARELPIGLFIEQMPQSLHVLEALYAKLLFGIQSTKCSLSTCPVYAQLLKVLQPESVTMHLVKLFALRTQTSHVLANSSTSGSNANEPSVLHCTLPTPFADRLDSNQLLMLTIRKLLRAILQVQPAIKKQLAARKRAIDGAIDALGHHGLVSVSGRASAEFLQSNGYSTSTTGSLMLSLQDAIRLECEQLVQQQQAIVAKLEQICASERSTKATSNGKSKSNLIRSASTSSSIGSTTSSTSGSGNAASNGSACLLPVGASHQRQLSLRPDQIQNRLLRNKQLLNAIEQFGARQQSLQLLMQMLDARIQYDKETLFQFAQLRKEFNYCCTVSRRLCGALLGNAGISTLDGAHSCIANASVGNASSAGSGSNGVGKESTCVIGTNKMTSSVSSSCVNNSDQQHRNASMAGNSSVAASGNQTVVTNHVMGCCIESNAVVAPVLMRFSLGCAQVLQLFEQVTSELPQSDKYGSQSVQSNINNEDACAQQCETNQATTVVVAPNANGNAGEQQMSLKSNDFIDTTTKSLPIDRVADCGNFVIIKAGKSNNNNSHTNIQECGKSIPVGVLVDLNDSHTGDNSNETTGVRGTANGTVKSNQIETTDSNHITIKGSIWTQSVHFNKPRSDSANEVQTSAAPADDSNEAQQSLHQRLKQAESRVQHLQQVEQELRLQLLQHQQQQQQQQSATTTDKCDKASSPRRATAAIAPVAANPDRSTNGLTNTTLVSVVDPLQRLDADSTSESTASVSFNNFETFKSDSTSRVVNKRYQMQLIRRFGDLYSHARVDTLEALDKLEQLRDAPDLKNKLLFSILVLSFRVIQKCITELKQKVYTLLHIKQCNSLTDAHALMDANRQQSMMQFESALNTYLSNCADQFDLSNQIQEVHEQICSTLYEYGSLRKCEELRMFTNDCVRVAWSLSTHSPAFVIRFDSIQFDSQFHVRFHTSNASSTSIQGHIWPALYEEGTTGSCVYKAVVIT